MRSLALWRAAGLAVLLAVAALIPLAGNVVLTQVGVLVLMYVGAAVGWNIFSGFTGYISLGAAVFFAPPAAPSVAMQRAYSRDSWIFSQAS